MHSVEWDLRQNQYAFTMRLGINLQQSIVKGRYSVGGIGKGGRPAQCRANCTE